jgi:hypothetical protein
MILQLSGYHLKMPGNRANSVQAHLIGFVPGRCEEAAYLPALGCNYGYVVNLQDYKQASKPRLVTELTL